MAAGSLSQGLGHGAVLTYPDKPYLKWRFTYESGEEAIRDNPKDFLEGCEALHKMFSKFKTLQPDFGSDDGILFLHISDKIKAVLATQGSMEERIQAWRDIAESGELFAAGGESIPEYNQDLWAKQWEDLKETDDSSDAINQNIYCFYQAASTHRNYVLRDLLPSYLLVAH